MFNFRTMSKFYTNAYNFDTQKYIHRKLIEKMTFLKCSNTNYSINKRTNMIENININKNKNNYFDYLETFDGELSTKYEDKIFLYKYYNINGLEKINVLKQKYHFIEEQYKCLKKNDKYIFMNIFSNTINNADYYYFNYLSNLPEYKNIYHKCFIGDLGTLNNWLSKLDNKI